MTSNWVLGQSTEYTGIVMSKGDKMPLPGVGIQLKGTGIGTTTDLDGRFKISVPDSLNVLTFSFIGYNTSEYKLGKKASLVIYLKEDCQVCYFDAQQIGLYLQSGVINNPIGGHFDFSFPDFMGTPTLKSSIGYQTNLDNNTFLDSYLSLEHLFVDCDFSMDFSATFKRLDFNHSISFSSYGLETILNKNRIGYLLGIRTMRLGTFGEKKDLIFNSISVGLRTEIGRPFYTSIYAKTSIYRGLYEYQFELRRVFKRFSSFMRYYQIGDFNEISLGIGMQFTYYLKRQDSI